MPLYEYQCVNAHKITRRRAFAEYDLPMRCPQCGGPMRHLISTGVSHIIK